VKRGWFWPLIGVGSALYALAAASFAYAFANRNYADANRIDGQLSEGWTNYGRLLMRMPALRALNLSRG
jgi:hypothetical protein